MEETELYVLYFNEWGWEEGEEQRGNVLGVFTDKGDAEIYEAEAMFFNTHGDYDIKKVPLNEFYKYGY